MYMSVYVTAENEQEAERIVETAISKRLAACANIFPVKSIYRWQGEIVRENEYAIILKTEQSLFDRLKDAIVDVHSYDIPCIVAWPIEKGYIPYLTWIADSL